MTSKAPAERRKQVEAGAARRDFELVTDLAPELDRVTVDFVVADMHRVPFVDGAFDLVTMSAALHHARDPVATLQQARRLLRPGGAVLCVNEPVKGIFRDKENLHGHAAGVGEHLYSARTYLGFFRKAGLDPRLHFPGWVDRRLRERDWDRIVYYRRLLPLARPAVVDATGSKARKGSPLSDRHGPLRTDVDRRRPQEVTDVARPSSTGGTAAVIGAAGFIGSHLCQELQKGGVEVLGIDRNPIDPRLGLAGTMQAIFPGEAVCRAITEAHWDTVFLLAGTAAVGPSLANPLGDLTANATDLLSFLEVMRARRVGSSFVFVSSAAVYGEATELPLRIDSPTQPVSPYGVSKLASELYLRLYARLHELRTVAVRPFSVYGPRLRKQVIWDLLCRFERQQPIVLDGTGQETRDFVFVEDVCRAMVRVAQQGLPGSVYNICSEEETSIAQLAEKLSALMGGRPVEFSGRVRPGDPVRWRGACPELRALGWAPRMPLDDGLRQTVRWFVDGKVMASAHL